MEKELDRVIEEIMSTPNVNGCLIADHQGLCLASKGSAHVDSAGIIVAISEQACKIQPNLKPPTVCLETDTKQCLIQRHGTITGAIFKQKSYDMLFPEIKLKVPTCSYRLISLLPVISKLYENYS